MVKLSTHQILIAGVFSPILAAVPFVVTLLLAMSERRRSASTASGKIGLLAVLSLALAWLPVKGMTIASGRPETSRSAESLLRRSIPSTSTATRTG